MCTGYCNAFSPFEMAANTSDRWKIGRPLLLASCSSGLSMPMAEETTSTSALFIFSRLCPIKTAAPLFLSSCKTAESDTSEPETVIPFQLRFWQAHTFPHRQAQQNETHDNFPIPSFLILRHFKRQLRNICPCIDLFNLFVASDIRSKVSGWCLKLLIS